MTNNSPLEGPHLQPENADLAFLDSVNRISFEPRLAKFAKKIQDFLTGEGRLRIHEYTEKQLLDLDNDYLQQRPPQSDVVFHGLEKAKPRGSKAALEGTNTLREVIPEYLLKLIALTGGADGPIGRQFIARKEEENAAKGATVDALEEEHYAPLDENGERIEGLTHKYGKRVLVTFTFDCAAYCRFCTRGRKVGGAYHTLSDEKIRKALRWIKEKSRAGEINEVILSGGDPLMMRPEALQYVTMFLGNLHREGSLRSVRIGTRLPIHNPYALDSARLRALENLHRPDIMMHINHPAEITDDFLEKRYMLPAHSVIRSQTVLLKGVNDNQETMVNLLNKLIAFNIVPYYIFVNDKQSWTTHHDVDFTKIFEIFKGLRAQLTGLTHTFNVVIDVEDGRGKIPIPIDYFDFWATPEDLKRWALEKAPRFRDFDQMDHTFFTGERHEARAVPAVR